MLHFAVAGVPHSTPRPGGTIEGIKHAYSLDITAMEMEWVQRVPISPERMEEIRLTAKACGNFALTVHAPFYINLNSEKEETIEASIKRILDALAMAEIAGAVSVCVHAAFNHNMPPERVMDNVRRSMDEIMQKKSVLFPHVNLGLETMGKQSQFGTLDEVLRVSKEFDCYPVIDPAHMHARSNGKVNTKAEWHEMFDMYAEYLGDESLQKMHLHFSGIAYGPKGEKHHVPLEESDARWYDFIQVLYERKVGGVCVSESPLLEEDTLRMKRVYESIS
jgi:deoxyribonuclease-4